MGGPIVPLLRLTTLAWLVLEEDAGSEDSAPGLEVEPG